MNILALFIRILPHLHIISINKNPTTMEEQKEETPLENAVEDIISDTVSKKNYYIVIVE